MLAFCEQMHYLISMPTSTVVLVDQVTLQSSYSHSLCFSSRRSYKGVEDEG